jgi:hypothetical protein
MRSALKAAATYFGLSGDDDDEDEAPRDLRLLGPDLRGAAIRGSALAVVSTAAFVVLLDWELSALAIPAVVGFAEEAGHGFADVRGRLPEERLPPPPGDVAWETRPRPLGRLASIFWVAAPGGWAIYTLVNDDLFFDAAGELGGLLFPGALAGFALANLAGARRVRQWEARHGMRVAVCGEGESERSFAVHPLAVAARREQVLASPPKPRITS